MILTDFIPLAPTDPTPTKTATKALIAAKTTLRNMKSIDAVTAFANYDEQTFLQRMNARLNETLQQQRLTVFNETASLPEELKEKNDVLTKAANTPKVELETVREVADRLSFAAMPFEYLDPRSYQNESYDMQRAISGFRDSLSKWFNVYVLAPVHFYDIDRHVNNTDDLPLYAGTNVAQAFMAISMTLPMFRSVVGNIKQLKQHSRELAAQAERMQLELKSMSRRLEELRVQVERQQMEALIREKQNAKLKAELEEIRAQSRFMAYEPMMFAFPKKKTILDDCRAIVGPCWGPDFPDIVTTVLGFTAVKNQRAALAQHACSWAVR